MEKANGLNGYLRSQFWPMKKDERKESPKALEKSEREGYKTFESISSAVMITVFGACILFTIGAIICPIFLALA